MGSVFPTAHSNTYFENIFFVAQQICIHSNLNNICMNYVFAAVPDRQRNFLGYGLFLVMCMESIWSHSLATSSANTEKPNA